MSETDKLISKKAEGKKILIAGGGPCGAISACYLSQKGYDCEIYELRNDIRADPAAGGRSINLSLSERGRAALRGVGLEKEITDIGVKMYSRMIHKNTKSGDCFEIPYGNTDEHYLLSVNRLLLNKKLLTLAENFSDKVKINFNQKVLACNLNPKDGSKCSLQIEDRIKKQQKTVTGDLIIGADGLWSNVRKAMMRVEEVCFSQTYINHWYKELIMENNGTGNYRMAKNHLHIWPRGEFMMIGLANLDGSFTMTLFMPKDKFRALTNIEKVMEFFRQEFPDSIEFFTEKYLREHYFDWDPLPLCYIKTDPYYYKDNAVLVGDAAHAIVPFYGQGLNAGLEDVLQLANLVDSENHNLGSAIKKYSDHRVIHGHAIADLALYNYWVMRDGVNSWWFRFKKYTYNLLNKIVPSFVTPLYTLVSFSLTPYKDAWDQHQRLEKMIAVSFVGL